MKDDALATDFWNEVRDVAYSMSDIGFIDQISLGKYSGLLNELILDACQLSMTLSQKHTQYSTDLNVFTLLPVNEKTHSTIIGNLLNPRGSHGQGHVFLNLFLELLGIQRYSDSENWLVATERGNVDILLKRQEPHSVILIENKSNYAIDQPNQLYRYWYYEIYKPLVMQYETIPSYIPPEDCYQIIYLSPNINKSPSKSSLSRPDNFDNFLPKTIPMKIKTLLFEEFMIIWLLRCIEKIPNSNTRLKEHLKQYKETWSYE